MTLPVRIPPVVERWDCHGCGRCCRAVLVALSDADVARLQSQRWDQHPDYRGVRIMVRQGLWKKGYRLALNRQNQCVFLTAQGRCRIHELHGEPAKPLLCRMFPFQLAPLDGYALVTLRRHCPSAAADLGHTLEEQLPTIRDLAAQRPAAPASPEPPPLLARHRRSWSDFLRVAETLERFLLDQRFPLVRRLAHGLKLCDLLEQCRLQNFSGRAIGRTPGHAGAFGRRGNRADFSASVVLRAGPAPCCSGKSPWNTSDSIRISSFGGRGGSVGG